LAITTEMIKELREATGAGILDCKKALEAANGNFDEAVNHLREKGLAAAAKKASRAANDGLVSVWVNDAADYGVVVEVNCETDFVARTEDFRAFVDTIVEQVVAEADVADVPALLVRPFLGDPSITVEEKLTQVVSSIGENIVLRRFDRVKRSGPGLVEGYTHLGSRIGVAVVATVGDAGVAMTEGFRTLVHDIALQVAAAAPQYLVPDDIPAAEVEAEKAIYKAQIAEDKKPDHIKERIVDGKLGKWYEQVCLMNQVFIKDSGLTIEQLLAQKGKELGSSIKIEKFIRFELGEGQ
jgi:elongation factor Ts